MSRTEREERGRVCRGSRGRREGVYVAVEGCRGRRGGKEGVYVAVEGCRGRRGGREGVYVAGGVLRKEREEGGRV